MTDPAASQDSGLTVQNPRARRLSKAELRERVLSAGATLLAEAGVTVSLYHLNMEELIRRVGVPRSSAFAAFGGKEELVTELMVQLLRPPAGDPVGFSPATVAVAEQVLERYGDRVTRADGSRDPDGAYAVLREAIRVTLRQNVEETAESAEWQTFLALAASLPSLPPARRERVAEALRAAEAQFTEAMTEFYSVSFARLGRAPRDGVQWHQVVTAGASIVEGVVSRRRMGSPAAHEIVIAPGIDGEPVEWTLAALAYLAVVDGLTVAVE
ncbi:MULTISPECIES: TetR/AcrR family transcriptional regulator [unclassified Microbacterium]|uniref:TetR/AcrR family transcriptional regulator n=1 Tax=unclassified Microbacterium TaxID=2609290 RepID=UPI003744D88D